MLARIVHDLGAQIRRRPRAQRCRQKNQQRARRDHDAAEQQRRWTVLSNRWRDQMPQRGDEIGVIESRKKKPDRENPRDNPEPLLEFEFARTHGIQPIAVPIREK